MKEVQGILAKIWQMSLTWKTHIFIFFTWNYAP